MKLLGIDVGTGGTRAVVIDKEGNVVASATGEHEPFASPQPGWAEQDPADWWRATIEAVRGVLAHLGASAADEIAGIGFSGQMHGSTLLDENQQILRPALIWCDQRTADQCSSITEKIGAARLIELTSNPALTGFTLPKMLWVRDREPDVWPRVRSVLLPKDYLRYKLTGDVVSLDQQTQTANIKGDKIEGWMEAMTMEYPVRDKAEFAKLAVGDRISATVFVDDVKYHIGEIQVTGKAAAAPK